MKKYLPISCLLFALLCLTSCEKETAIAEVVQLSEEELAERYLLSYQIDVIFANVKIDHVQNTLTGYLIDKLGQLKYLKETDLDVLMHSGYEQGTVPMIPIQTLDYRAEVKQKLDPIQLKEFVIKAFSIDQSNEVTIVDESADVSYFKLNFKPEREQTSVGSNTCNTGYNSSVDINQVLIQSLGQTENQVTSSNQKEIIEWLDSFEASHSYLN